MLNNQNKESLFEKMYTIENIQKAWYSINKENIYSHGLSTITIEEYSIDIENKLKMLSKSIKNKEFKFSPTRAALIKKDNGKYRPLQIPEVQDRIVLKAIQNVIESDQNEKLKKSTNVSFAYQKGKGVKDALLKLKSHFHTNKELLFIFKTDIVNFFEEINKNELLNNHLFPFLSDNSINHLITEALNQPLKGLNKINRDKKHYFKLRKRGIPQGNPLSPFLSNIYLSNFDLKLKEIGIIHIRYADDFIILCKTKDEAISNHHYVKDFLKNEYNLSIHPIEENDKTSIININKTPLTFLSIVFDGIIIYPKKQKKNILISKIELLIKENKKDLKIDIYKTIDFWIARYSYTNLDIYFDEIDENVKVLLKKNNIKMSIQKCKKIADKRRTKQHNKSKNNIWHLDYLKSILPDFNLIERFKSKNATHNRT